MSFLQTLKLNNLQKDVNDLQQAVVSIEAGVIPPISTTVNFNDNGITNITSIGMNDSDTKADHDITLNGDGSRILLDGIVYPYVDVSNTTITINDVSFNYTDIKNNGISSNGHILSFNDGTLRLDGTSYYETTQSLYLGNNSIEDVHQISFNSGDTLIPSGDDLKYGNNYVLISDSSSVNMTDYMKKTADSDLTMGSNQINMDVNTTNSSLFGEDGQLNLTTDALLSLSAPNISLNNARLYDVSNICFNDNANNQLTANNGALMWRGQQIHDGGSSTGLQNPLNQAIVDNGSYGIALNSGTNLQQMIDNPGNDVDGALFGYVQNSVGDPVNYFHVPNNNTLLLFNYGAPDAANGYIQIESMNSVLINDVDIDSDQNITNINTLQTNLDISVGGNVDISGNGYINYGDTSTLKSVGGVLLYNDYPIVNADPDDGTYIYTANTITNSGVFNSSTKVLQGDQFNIANLANLKSYDFRIDITFQFTTPVPVFDCYLFIDNQFTTPTPSTIYTAYVVHISSSVMDAQNNNTKYVWSHIMHDNGGTGTGYTINSFKYLMGLNSGDDNYIPQTGNFQMNCYLSAPSSYTLSALSYFAYSAITASGPVSLNNSNSLYVNSSNQLLLNNDLVQTVNSHSSTTYNNNDTIVKSLLTDWNTNTSYNYDLVSENFKCKGDVIVKNNEDTITIQDYYKDMYKTNTEDLTFDVSGVYLNFVMNNTDASCNYVFNYSKTQTALYKGATSISYGSDVVVDVGDSVSKSVSITNQPTRTVSFGISPSLGNGLSINTTTGLISGTTSSELTATNYTITMTDSNGLTYTDVLNITINSGVLGYPTNGLLFYYNIKDSYVSGSTTVPDETNNYPMTMTTGQTKNVDGSAPNIIGSITPIGLAGQPIELTIIIVLKWLSAGDVGPRTFIAGPYVNSPEQGLYFHYNSTAQRLQFYPTDLAGSGTLLRSNFVNTISMLVLRYNTTDNTYLISRRTTGENTTIASGTYTSFTTFPNQPIYIGQNINGVIANNNNYQVYDIMYYTRPLTDTEINDIFTNQFSNRFT